MGNIGSSSTIAGIPPVKPSGYETSTIKRDRTLKHLLKANHQSYAVLYSRLRFHNHLPHVLGSAYLLGASADHLQALYDEESRDLNPWADSPAEISRGDWRSFLSDRTYQRAYLDFFEDELVRLDYDWRMVVMEYMLSGPEPLIHGTIGGLGHPLIHLGYAFELNNKDIAMEALVLSATNYNFLHKYIDGEFATDVATALSSMEGLTPAELLSQISQDERLNGLFDNPGVENITRLFEKAEDVVLEYLQKYTISDITTSHRGLSKLATLLLIGTNETEYDFFLCHLLTTSWAIRVLLPEMPQSFAFPMLKSLWLFVIVVYTIQLRPNIKPELIDSTDTGGKSWDEITAKALGQKKNAGELEDAHYLKVMRTCKNYAHLFAEDEEFYRKAAVKFGWTFKHWTGFGATEESAH